MVGMKKSMFHPKGAKGGIKLILEYAFQTRFVMENCLQAVEEEDKEFNKNLLKPLLLRMLLLKSLILLTLKSPSWASH